MLTKEEQVLEFIKCRENPLYYIGKYVKFNKVEETLSYSEDLFRPELKHIIRCAYKYHKVVSYKDRQVGATTINASLVSWAITFFPENTACIIDFKKFSIINFFKMVSFINENLPDFLRLDSKINHDQNKIIFGNKSVLYGFNRVCETIGVIPSVFVIDNANHISDFKEIFSSVMHVFYKTREEAIKKDYPCFISICIESYPQVDCVDSDMLFDKEEHWVKNSDSLVDNKFIMVKILRSKYMKVYKRGAFEVTKIEFCCKDMAEAVLHHKISTRQWTDHALIFFHNDLRLQYCPYCGAKIEGGCRE